jgi:hypothetical protein
MQKYKFGFWLILFLVLGLGANLWAQDKSALPYSNMPFQHKPKWMENSPWLSQEGQFPLSPERSLSPQTQKISRAQAGTGAVRGRVTQASGGAPIQGVTVQAEKLTCPYYYAADYSGSDGYYIIQNLPAGKYMVYTGNDSVFLDIYWNNQPDEGSADTVTVASNDTTENINFSLRVGGKITGSVTLTGASSVSVTVSATNTTSLKSYDGPAYNASGNSATYEIRGLPTGTYKVETDNSQGYIDVYYNNKSTYASADPVSVTEGSPTSSINFTLAAGGKITGKVTLPGALMVIVSIVAKDTTSKASYDGSAFAYGVDTASYEIQGLPTGTYKVYTWNYQGYLDEYYNDKSDWTSADPVSVVQGSTTSNKNFTLSLGGVIAGNISGSGALEDIMVWGFNASNPLEAYKYSSTDESGDYSLTGLQSGNWKIFAEGDTLHAFEWYNDKNNWNSADLVAVTAPDTVFYNDFDLEVGGSISGQVSGGGWSSLSGFDVYAYDTSYYQQGGFMMMKSDTTHTDGSYRIGGLRTGYYKVIVETECGSIWYNNKSSWSQADIVGVTMPNNTPNINFNLATSVEEEEDQTSQRPTEFVLSQNYPNPFNPETQIEYTLQSPAQVTLQIYNLLGQKVKTLVNEQKPAGSYRIFWDGKNEAGKAVASGIYFYGLKANGVSQTKRMVLLK